MRIFKRKRLRGLIAQRERIHLVNNIPPYSGPYGSGKQKEILAVSMRDWEALKSRMTNCLFRKVPPHRRVKYEISKVID